MASGRAIWMDGHTNRSMLGSTLPAGGSIAPPTEREKRRKIEMWKAMLDGRPVPEDVADTPSTTRKQKAQSPPKPAPPPPPGTAEKGCQDERKRVKQEGDAEYVCRRCGAVIAGGERQALAHWVSRCVKNLGRMEPPPLPIEGRFPPVSVRDVGQPAAATARGAGGSGAKPPPRATGTVATQETLNPALAYTGGERRRRQRAAAAAGGMSHAHGHAHPRGQVQVQVQHPFARSVGGTAGGGAPPPADRFVQPPQPLTTAARPAAGGGDAAGAGGDFLPHASRSGCSGSDDFVVHHFDASADAATSISRGGSSDYLYGAGGGGYGAYAPTDTASQASSDDVIDDADDIRMSLLCNELAAADAQLHSLLAHVSSALNIQTDSVHTNTRAECLEKLESLLHHFNTPAAAAAAAHPAARLEPVPPPTLSRSSGIHGNGDRGGLYATYHGHRSSLVDDIRAHVGGEGVDTKGTLGGEAHGLCGTALRAAVVSAPIVPEGPNPSRWAPWGGTVHDLPPVPSPMCTTVGTDAATTFLSGVASTSAFARTHPQGDPRPVPPPVIDGGSGTLAASFAATTAGTPPDGPSGSLDHVLVHLDHTSAGACENENGRAVRTEAPRLDGSCVGALKAHVLAAALTVQAAARGFAGRRGVAVRGAERAAAAAAARHPPRVSHVARMSLRHLQACGRGLAGRRGVMGLARRTTADGEAATPPACGAAPTHYPPGPPSHAPSSPTSHRSNANSCSYAVQSLSMYSCEPPGTLGSPLGLSMAGAAAGGGAQALPDYYTVGGSEGGGRSPTVFESPGSDGRAPARVRAVGDVDGGRLHRRLEEEEEDRGHWRTSNHDSPGLGYEHDHDAIDLATPAASLDPATACGGEGRDNSASFLWQQTATSPQRDADADADGAHHGRLGSGTPPCPAPIAAPTDLLLNYAEMMFGSPAVGLAAAAADVSASTSPARDASDVATDAPEPPSNTASGGWAHPETPVRSTGAGDDDNDDAGARDPGVADHEPAAAVVNAGGAVPGCLTAPATNGAVDAGGALGPVGMESACGVDAEGRERERPSPGAAPLPDALAASLGAFGPSVLWVPFALRIQRAGRGSMARGALAARDRAAKAHEGEDGKAAGGSVTAAATAAAVRVVKKKTVVVVKKKVVIKKVAAASENAGAAARAERGDVGPIPENEGGVEKTAEPPPPPPPQGAEESQQDRPAPQAQSIEF